MMYDIMNVTCDIYHVLSCFCDSYDVTLSSFTGRIKRSQNRKIRETWIIGER